jgi:hypothetical protein
MQSAAMAEEVKPVEEPGAPYPPDQLDPDLIKLPRPKLAVGAVSAAGVVFLCAFFAWKLNSDRRFGGAPEAPTRATVQDIASGKFGPDSHVVVDAEPLMAHAIRSATQKGSIGMRVVPARGSSEKLWLVLPGDGWSEPSTGGYVGRLRPLEDLPIADSISAFLGANPRPMFAPASAVRAGFGSNKVTTVAGDTISIRDTDKVGFDVIDPTSATIICSFNERHANTKACIEALSQAGITTTKTSHDGREQSRFLVAWPTPDAVTALRIKLETAKLWGITVEPVTQHHETTWAQLKTSPPTGFTVAAATIPDAQLDLIGVYVSRSLPDGAFALIGGERPQDYWYVLPVTIVVLLIGLLFAWAFVRAVKRDLLPGKAP